MLVLNRYLVKEVFYTLFAVVTVLMLIFVSGQLIALYAKVAGGALHLKSVLISLGLNSISNLVFVLPLSFYIALLLAFSRLYKDNEMVVLSACGIGLYQILRTFTWPAVIFALLVGALALYVAPWAESQYEVLLKQAKERSDIEGITAGRFNELTHGEGVVYTQQFNETVGTMGNVFLQHELKDRSLVITAANGKREINDQTGDRFFILYNGYRYDTEYSTGRSAVVRFGEHAIRVADEPERKRLELRQRAMATLDLWQRRIPSDIAEIQWRFSSILMVLILAIVALPLSRTSPRQGRYAKLAVALLVYVIYTNMLNVARAWISKEVISPWLGMWWVHAVAVTLALLLYVDWKPVKHHLRRLLRRT